MASRGQLSVEFFLAAAFLFALAAAMLSSAEVQLSEVESLQKAVLARQAVDSVAAWVNLVHLQGNGAQIAGNVFIPKGSVCMIIGSKAEGEALACDAHPSIATRVYSRTLYSSSLSFATSCPPSSPKSGWFRFTVKNNAGAVEVSCQVLE